MVISRYNTDDLHVQHARIYLCQFPASFSFIFIFLTVNRKNALYKFLPMTGFEPQTSNIRSDLSLKWAKTTAHILVSYFWYFSHFSKEWAILGLFFIYFVFSNKPYKFFQQINVKLSPSGIQCWDLNSQRLEHEYSPITTRPHGSRPILTTLTYKICEFNWTLPTVTPCPRIERWHSDTLYLVNLYHIQ